MNIFKLGQPFINQIKNRAQLVNSDNKILSGKSPLPLNLTSDIFQSTLTFKGPSPRPPGSGVRGPAALKVNPPPQRKAADNPVHVYYQEASSSIFNNAFFAFMGDGGFTSPVAHPTAKPIVSFNKYDEELAKRFFARSPKNPEYVLEALADKSDPTKVSKDFSFHKASIRPEAFQDLVKRKLVVGMSEAEFNSNLSRTALLEVQPTLDDELPKSLQSIVDIRRLTPGDIAKYAPHEQPILKVQHEPYGGFIKENAKELPRLSNGKLLIIFTAAYLKSIEEFNQYRDEMAKGLNIKKLAAENRMKEDSLNTWSYTSEDGQEIRYILLPNGSGSAARCFDTATKVRKKNPASVAESSTTNARRNPERSTREFVRYAVANNRDEGSLEYDEDAINTVAFQGVVSLIHDKTQKIIDLPCVMFGLLDSAKPGNRILWRYDHPQKTTYLKSLEKKFQEVEALIQEGKLTIPTPIKTEPQDDAFDAMSVDDEPEAHSDQMSVDDEEPEDAQLDRMSVDEEPENQILERPTRTLRDRTRVKYVDGDSVEKSIESSSDEFEDEEVSTESEGSEFEMDPPSNRTTRNLEEELPDLHMEDDEPLLATPKNSKGKEPAGPSRAMFDQGENPSSSSELSEAPSNPELPPNWELKDTDLEHSGTPNSPLEKTTSILDQLHEKRELIVKYANGKNSPLKIAKELSRESGQEYTGNHVLAYRYMYWKDMPVPHHCRELKETTRLLLDNFDFLEKYADGEPSAEQIAEIMTQKTAVLFEREHIKNFKSDYWPAMPCRKTGDRISIENSIQQLLLKYEKELRELATGKRTKAELAAKMTKIITQKEKKEVPISANAINSFKQNHWPAMQLPHSGWIHDDSKQSQLKKQKKHLDPLFAQKGKTFENIAVEMSEILGIEIIASDIGNYKKMNII